MSIQILAKHALQFDHPTEAFDSVKVKYQEIATLPDWVAESSTFKAAKEAGVISILEGSFISLSDKDVKAKVLHAEEVVAKESKKNAAP